MSNFPHNDLQRDVGRIEGTLAGMDQRMDRLENLVSEGFADIKKELSEDRKQNQEILTAMKVRIETLEANSAHNKGVWSISQKIITGAIFVAWAAITAGASILYNHWFPAK